ncbi:MAG: SDR family oxidoreductase [Chloroflexi bacterium]|nr:SDR family oxidoreductase [Chloroflexota bacterium]
MRVLVTGASGLLGLNLALEAAGSHTVWGVVHSHHLSTRVFTVLAADLLDEGALERVLDEARPDWIIHCAALANLEYCEKDPDLAQRLNADLPGLIAAETAQRGIRLLHISTDAVFDGRRGNYSEKDAPNPISVYGRTKLAGEQVVSVANPGAIIARVNFYGWSLQGDRSLAEFFFNSLKAGKAVKGFTDVFFCPLLANDLARILLRMLDANMSGLYHVVSSESLSKYEFGVALARQFGLGESLILPASVDEGGLKASRSPFMTLRVDKLARAFGEPPPGILPGLERFYQLYRQGHPALLRYARSTD